MLKSPICDLLGITYPIFQGAMAWISDADLAAAVSNAGGLGIIAGGNAPTAVIQDQIRRARTLTDKPFGVNIMLMSPNAAEVAEMVAQEKVAVVTTGAGNPSKYMKTWHDAGVTVIPVVPSTGIARLMQRAGAAAVIAEGGESGGHVGELTTMALLPQVCDAVTIPVMGAGGIADGRGMAAAFMLGACGVQVGTRFLVAKECNIHPTYKAKILKARDIDTMATGRRLGHPVRSIKTPFVQEFLKKEYDSTVSDQELEKFGEGSLRMAVQDGDEQRGTFLAGQISGMVHEEQTAAEIVSDIVNGAERVLKTAASWIV